MRSTSHLLFLVFFLLFSICQVQAAPVTVSDTTVTDVTPSSFSVLWNGDQAAIPDLRIFADANGSQELTGQITVTAYPLKGTHTSTQEGARDNGVLIIRAANLSPATSYYYQTTTISAATGEITLTPAAAPFPSVTTQDNSVRTDIPDATEYLFTNDTILINTPLEDGSDPAEGTVVTVLLTGSNYPVSGIVGDGVSLPFAAMDGANIYDASQHINMPLHGGEEVTVTRFLGTNGTETFRSYLLPPRQLAQQRGLVGLHEVMRVLQITSAQPDKTLDLDYDINNDGMIGVEETLYFLQIMADLR